MNKSIKINTKNAFAVRFSNNLSVNMLSFLEMTERAANNLPRFKVEGVNSKMRDLVVKEEKAEFIISDLYGGKFEVGTGKLKVRNLIGVGTDKYKDVAYVAESDLKVSENLFLVPIYDVDVHYNVIVERFRKYLCEVYHINETCFLMEPTVVATPVVEKVEFSDFVRVGNSRVDRDDLKLLAGALENVGCVKPKKKKKNKKKEVKVTYPGIHGLLFNI